MEHIKPQGQTLCCEGSTITIIATVFVRALTLGSCPRMLVKHQLHKLWLGDDVRRYAQLLRQRAELLVDIRSPVCDRNLSVSGEIHLTPDWLSTGFVMSC